MIAVSAAMSSGDEASPSSGASGRWLYPTPLGVMQNRLSRPSVCAAAIATRAERSGLEAIAVRAPLSLRRWAWSSGVLVT